MHEIMISNSGNCRLLTWNSAWGKFLKRLSEEVQVLCFFCRATTSLWFSYVSAEQYWENGTVESISAVKSSFRAH